MSGVYIKGMEMQTNCYECPVNKYDGFGYFTCGITNSECDWLKLPNDCPLIPVPDHGRLIDADALMLRVDIHGTNNFGMLDEDIREFINNAPTIIPADKEGDR